MSPNCRLRTRAPRAPTLTLAALALSGLIQPTSARQGDRLERIVERGSLTCGVEPDVPGFAAVDDDGHYTGLDVDMCRALSAAIFGTPDRVEFVHATSVADFLREDAIDVVSRRITWELRREGLYGLIFGPVMFYDGQGFLAARSLGATGPEDLAGERICVAGATIFEANLNEFYREHPPLPVKDVLEDPHDFAAIVDALTSGRCTVYSSDLSLLGVVRSRLQHPDDFEILERLISREPLAQIVRADDPRFFNILRWTVFALINAEELGISSANVDGMLDSPNRDVRRLLGVEAGNGSALGLRESWAYDVIRTLGNYGELFEKHVGRGSPLGLDRGLNHLARDGGLLYAPPLR